jgi:hypothetical protein
MTQPRNASYRVVKNGTAWHWELLGPDQKPLASGSAQSSVKARVAAMAAGLEFLESDRRSEQDKSAGVGY